VPPKLAAVAGNILKRLNPKQREAVAYCSGPLLVIAGPGTGKTRVITEKVLYLIAEHGMAPESILALTFTEKAAGEMTDRIRGRLAEVNVRGQPLVSTFHSFCYNLVQEFADRLGLRGALRLLCGPLYVQFVVDQLDHLVTHHTYLVDRTTTFARTLADFASRCHDEGLIDRNLVKEADAWLETLPAGDRKAGLEVHDLAASLPILLERQYASHVVSYGDLLTLAVRLLRENDDLRRQLQARYQYILVDELQDNNTVQFELVNLLAERHRRILVVGDEDQCIYRFRGAGLGLLERFQTQWESAPLNIDRRMAAKPASGLHIVNLEENFRSTTAIIETCTTLIRNNTQRFQQKVLRRAEALTKNPPAGPLFQGQGEGKSGPDKVVLARLETDELERRYLVHEIGQRLRSGIRKPGDIAVLCRSLGHVTTLVSDLRGAGMAVEVVGEGGLFSNPVVREILAWLKALDNPGAEEVALHRVIRLQSFGLSFADQYALGKAARLAKAPMMTLIESLANGKSDPIPGVSPRGLRHLVRLSSFYREFKKQSQAESQPDLVWLINQIVGVSGLNGRLKLETPQGRQNINAVNGLLQMAKNYEEHYPDPRLHGFMRFLDLLEEVGHDETIGSPTEDETTIKVMTVHQAKGREFPVVVIGGLSDRFPSQNRREWHRKFLDYLTIQGQDVELIHQEEERRVLYVALSRAQEELLLSAYEKRNGQPVQRVSPFPDELTAASAVETCTIPAESVTALVPGAEALRTREAIEMRLHYLISRLGVHLNADVVDETFQEALRLMAALLAQASGEERVRQVLAQLGLPHDWQLPAPAAEAMPCITGPLRLSPSALQNYYDCPRQYYYKYVVGIPQPARTAARLGTAIHKALELFHGKHVLVNEAHLPELIELFQAEVAQVEFDSQRERDQAMARGRALLTQHLEEEAARCADIANLEVEKVLTLSLADDVTLETRIDRIDTLADGRVRIIDYKTGELDTRPEYLRNFQMPCYAWVVQEALGRELEQVEVIGLKNLTETAKGMKIDRKILPWDDGTGYALTPGRLQELQREVKAAVAGIRSGQFDAQPEEQRCSWCAYRLLCDRAWGTSEPGA
jgi:DNA helicase-2/ATP-dependent DNA helicase PcrA